MNSATMLTSRSDMKGFTLIELMVSMVISAFLIGGILLMQSSGRAASMESEQLSRVQENIRFTSDFLVRELRNAGFRDELSLKIDMFNEFTTQGFANVNADGDEITIRMSGARSCGNVVPVGAQLGSLITNRYFVENGSLMCQGTMRVPDPPPGVPDTTVFAPIALANGIQDISFAVQCPGGPPCTCTLWGFAQTQLEQDSLNTTCHSVLVDLTFEGAGNPVDVQLRAAFRNVVLGRLQWSAVPPP